MIVIGAATAVGASLIAIAQIDVKRCLSYSVSAYMGLVFIAVATGQEAIALKLLLIHCVSMALLVMAVGGVVLNNISQDLRDYGGLGGRRPISAIAYLVGGLSLVAFPPLGGFWVLSEFTQALWLEHPALAVLVIVVNGLTAFSVSREFCGIFGGEAKAMTVRSPEGLWPLVLPMMFLTGIVLHLPLLLGVGGLLPNWYNFNPGLIGLLVLSTLLGGGLAGYIYLNDKIKKPIILQPQALQDFFAYDFYTPELYRLIIVGPVNLVSRLISWFDRFIIDGVVNLVGLATVFSGETLKYNVSGQTQFYALSILIGVAILFILILL
jgi:NAD(P)H-quinone oxidoreductase subunit 5